MNLIFTCGGTAGHINPALAVANMMRQRHPDCKILFIGAQGHMEEKLVSRVRIKGSRPRIFSAALTPATSPCTAASS